MPKRVQIHTSKLVGVFDSFEKNISIKKFPQDRDKNHKCLKPQSRKDCCLSSMDKYRNTPQLRDMTVIFFQVTSLYPPWKLTNDRLEHPPWMKMYFLLNMVIFKCHLSFQMFSESVNYEISHKSSLTNHTGMKNVNVRIFPWFVFFQIFLHL